MVRAYFRKGFVSLGTPNSRIRTSSSLEGVHFFGSNVTLLTMHASQTCLHERLTGSSSLDRPNQSLLGTMRIRANLPTSTNVHRIILERW
jgi:hypothetical protein